MRLCTALLAIRVGAAWRAPTSHAAWRAGAPPSPHPRSLVAAAAAPPLRATAGGGGAAPRRRALSSSPGGAGVAGALPAFADLEINPLLRRNIKEGLGLTTLTPVQARTLPPLLAGKDVLAKVQSRT